MVSAGWSRDSAGEYHGKATVRRSRSWRTDLLPDPKRCISGCGTLEATSITSRNSRRVGVVGRVR